MSQINDFFYITISSDKMFAEIHCKKAYESIDIQLEIPLLIQFLKDNKVNYGVDQKTINLLLNINSTKSFPMTIAKGEQPVNGVDGEITFIQEDCTKAPRGDDWNFRDVMQIPSVKKGDKLAVVSPPTKGKDGMNVQGTVLRARSGKPTSMQVGKGVSFKVEDQTFYANKEGQMNVNGRLIQVDDVYTVDETLSMKTGNLDFVGSIVIKGDVPTGYTVKAAGNITIHGIVEAANIISGGSIYISEGLSGLRTGFIKADKDIYIGYINQGVANAGQSIYVENSIIHSECTAKEHILCQHGNIIGGSLSVGMSIEAGDIGNRLSTETAINLGLNKEIDDERTELETKREELAVTLKQLDIIGKKLTVSEDNLDAKMRIMVLRHRRSYEQITKKFNHINEKLERMDAYLGSEEKAYLVVKNHLHPNVVISFGKYKRKINKLRRTVQLKLENNDIVIHALKQ